MAPGCLEDLPAYLRSKKAQNILLVSDEGVSGTDWFGRLRMKIEGQVTVYSRIPANPPSTEIDQLSAESRTKGYDTVLAIGGGSVLDAGKAVAMLLKNEGSIVDFEGKDKFSNGSIPFVAVPTTCGTGSEVTWVAVVTVPEIGSKISIKGDGMFPMAAFVDADVLISLPPHLIASTGMDAVTHALEALVSRLANPASDALALESMRLLIRHLGPCVRNPERREHRKSVMHASTIAGMAFGNADVGAVHCLSESIGGLLNHPHGLLNTLLLVPVLRFQLDHIRDRLRMISAFLGAPRPESLLDRLETMVAGFPLKRWADLEINPDQFEQIALMAEANGSNPSNIKELRASDYLSILRAL